MGLNVEKEVVALKAMTVPELRARYAEVFGEECRSHHKALLWKRIIWRMQANQEGGLSERARRRAEELANDADLRLHAPETRTAVSTGGCTATGRIGAPPDSRLPVPGTVLVREYKGQTIRVTVLDDGFEYGGEVYRSLSAVAQKVTGAHWNGMLFFGLVGKEGKKA
ncbi:MAG TPA: DUF2924 domain-containing protein [Phycisphaerae bacterium]|nr:DUF2924 domain-containing protein [Phycisphaerae bacterium]